MRHIRRAVKKGGFWVVDVDITGYFNNFPHEKLMALVEQRISDRRILKLIRKSTVMHKKEEHRKAG
ncbi:hypothetical protein [Effusibacillus consociatus]